MLTPLLTETEVAFIERNGIANELFNGLAYESKKAAGRAAQKEGKRYILCASCPRGHRIHSHHGSCIECNPAGIAYARRSHMSGIVYVAWSKTLQLSKIGFTEDLEARTRTMISDGYAGVSDWKIVFDVESPIAGRVELEAHKALNAYASPRTYMRGNKTQIARELFNVSSNVAVTTVVNHLRVQSGDTSSVVSGKGRLSEYNAHRVRHARRRADGTWLAAPGPKIGTVCIDTKDFNESVKSGLVKLGLLSLQEALKCRIAETPKSIAVVRNSDGQPVFLVKEKFSESKHDVPDFPREVENEGALYENLGATQQTSSIKSVTLDDQKNSDSSAVRNEVSTMTNRPLLNLAFEGLETLYNENADNKRIVELVSFELSMRTSRKADELRKKIAKSTSMIESGPLSAESTTISLSTKNKTKPAGPPTPKQLIFAQAIAQKLKLKIKFDLGASNRAEIEDFISKHKSAYSVARQTEASLK
jgi:hypothetical protein